MSDPESYDAVVVGSGPNGLAAGVTLAQKGLSVVIFEARGNVGGGTQTAEITLPGFRHDLFSAIHPLAVTSPFLRTLPLAQYGLEWVHPEAPLAHPLDDGTAVLLDRSVDVTVETLGKDGPSYRNLIGPLVSHWNELAVDLLRPLGLPHHPMVFFRFAFPAIRSVKGLAHSRFDGKRARALFAGLGAHSILPLEEAGSAAVGLVVCASAHAVGWPMAKGGSQCIAYAMSEYFKSLGGRIVTSRPIGSVDELPRAQAILLDVTPRQILSMAPLLPAGYRRRLERYAYGPGAFKVDWALDGPIPWKAAECQRAATIHLGGTFEEVASAESKAFKNEHPDKPFVILTQQSLFDRTRCPKDKHTASAYCHVPNASTFDMTERIEAQVERFAPGFRDLILARHTMSPVEIAQRNANYVGGAITGGTRNLRQFAGTIIKGNPYSTPMRGMYVCSSSTPPGAGVHGMCGYYAALSAVHDIF